MTNETGVEPEGLTVVQDLVRTLSKGIRAVQLYLPNNPMYEQATNRMATAFAEVWDQLDEVALYLSESEIHWEDQTVYSTEATSESTPWNLFEDGIRKLTFLPGVEDDEIVRFMVVINTVRTLPPDSGDDLLTLLWEQEFDWIRYVTVELGEGDDEGEPIGGAGGGGGGTPPAPEEVREEVRRQVGGGGDGEPEQQFATVPDFEPALYKLEPEEVAYLKRELAREYDQDLRANVLAILFDIFETQTNPDTRTELVTILRNFLPHLLAAGDSASVVYVLRESRVVRQRAKDLLEQHALALEQLPAQLSKPETFGQLLEALEQGAAGSSDEELERLFGGLSPSVFETAIEWLPRIGKGRIKDLLEDALLKLAISHPDALAEALAAGNPAVVRMAVRFAKTLAVPEAVPNLGRLLESPDSALRAEVVDVLEVLGSPEAMHELERALHDEDRDIRIAAVRTLASHRHKEALAKVESIVTAGELKGADLTEKKAFFEAYGVMAGADGVELLSAMLLPRGFMKRKEDPQTRACAAMALGKIGTGEALAALKQAEADRDALVRNAVNRAIRERG